MNAKISVFLFVKGQNWFSFFVTYKILFLTDIQKQEKPLKVNY